jgi:ABC-type microcin C transport system permease subunit YejB
VNAYAIYAGKRLLQFALVVFIGINLAFVITHSTPIDPVEQTVATATAFGSTSPEAVEMMRQSLRELYGLEGSPWGQYAVFWKRIAVGDFGPSLSAFPTPVSVLINRALPWTIGLLTVSTLLAWILGNLLGGLAGYYRDSKILRIAGIVAMGVPSDSVLHRGVRVPDRVRLPLAGAADLRRLADERPMGMERDVHPERAATLDPADHFAGPRSASAAGSWACARSSPTS